MDSEGLLLLTDSWALQACIDPRHKMERPVGYRSRNIPTTRPSRCYAERRPHQPARTAWSRRPPCPRDPLIRDTPEHPSWIRTRVARLQPPGAPHDGGRGRTTLRWARTDRQPVRWTATAPARGMISGVAAGA